MVKRRWCTSDWLWAL